MLYVLATAVCYYAATQIAWVLCFPDSKVSLFFPPHAVLVSILLFVPTRQWWAYTLAAASAHFLATQQAHWPTVYALHCEVFDAVQNVGAAAGIRMLIHAGRVWARVVQAAGSRSTLTLESNDYTATAHDGLIGAEQSSAGTFVCWTRRGTLWLTDRSGQTDTVLVAGQRARARFGVPVTAEPFAASASALEIRTTGPVVPLVRMPDGSQAAGFLAPDVEVNQVFGSLTEGKGGQRWLVEVPGGHEGPYTLILTGTDAGPFTARIAARYAGFSAYRQEIRGEARPGERLFTRITQTVKGQDPVTARAMEASMDGLRVWDPSEPAATVASPAKSGPGTN